MDPLADIRGLLPLYQKASGGHPGVRIAVIDGPVDLSHPALSGARIGLGKQIAGLADPTVRSEHGTHVTSVLMGVPGSPVAGIAPNCTATVFSIYRESPNGELEPSSQATLALAINQAVADGADVINISSGQQTPAGQADRILADAVRHCADAGKLIIAAAGNDGCRCVQVPGALDSVLAVGACDLAGKPLPFSNFGDPYLDNGILAPGENVKGASPTAHVALRSGTSFATPIVTGVVALLLSYLRQSGRDADPRAVRAALLASAAPCDSRLADGELRCLAGRLDVFGAFAALLADARGAANLVSPSQTTAEISKPRAGGGVAEILHSATDAAGRNREETMGDFRISDAASTIFGPDGNAIKSAAGVVPSAAPTPPTSIAAPAGAGGAPADAAAPLTAASPPLAAPPTGAGVFWVPVSAPGSFPPGWAPIAGARDDP